MRQEPLLSRHKRPGGSKGGRSKLSTPDERCGIRSGGPAIFCLDGAGDTMNQPGFTISGSTLGTTWHAAFELRQGGSSSHSRNHQSDSVFVGWRVTGTLVPAADVNANFNQHNMCGMWQYAAQESTGKVVQSWQSLRVPIFYPCTQPVPAKRARVSFWAANGWLLMAKSRCLCGEHKSPRSPWA